MRVKILKAPHHGVYAEIEDITPNGLKVNLGEDTSVSLTIKDTKTAVVALEDVEIIDKGLNSPFFVEITKVIC